MYDDRGLDIVSNRNEVLKPIYSKFSSWILEINRREIEDNFSQK